ncbi:MAG: tetratricopeptide repeat protein, partial [Myxococcota bacterium]
RSAPPAAASAPPAMSEELEELLEEIDFYAAQQLWDAALAELEDALETFPGHPELLRRLADIEGKRASEAPPRSNAPATSDEDESFALAEKLAEELADGPGDRLGSDVIDVDAVFAQFKKGVEEQVGADDSDTHFDLGIAYKEMELFPDAIAEFELAMKNPRRECMCHTMIGLCYVEQARLTEAIGHFKRGLYAEHKTEREDLGLYYELGRAYELLEDREEALHYFQRVLRRAPDFPGVRARVDALQRSSTPGPALTLDDVDGAFGDAD